MGDGGRQEGRVSRAVVDSPLWEEGSNCHHAVTTIRGWLFHPVNTRIALSYALVFIDRDGIVRSYTPTRSTELVNGIVSSGSHSVKFDGVNLPSGMYFYRLESSGRSYLRKMLLLSVMTAREIQAQRFKGRKGLYANADMQSKDIREFCKLDVLGRSCSRRRLPSLGCLRVHIIGFLR